jgi:cytochrome c-type biogenesis protein CcmH/NrfG
MARKRQPKHPPEPGEPKRQGPPVLVIAFVIAMAAFLVVGLLAAAIPEFLALNDDESPPVAQNDQPSEEERLRERLDENPEDVASMVLLADLLANTGRGDEAIRWYERAIEHRPEQVSLRVAFGSVLMRYRYDLDAEIQFQRAIEIDPEEEEAMYLLAQLYEQSNPPRMEEAEEMYRRVIETSPESFYAQLARDALGESDDDADADDGS